MTYVFSLKCSLHVIIRRVTHNQLLPVVFHGSHSNPNDDSVQAVLLSEILHFQIVRILCFAARKKTLSWNFLQLFFSLYWRLLAALSLRPRDRIVRRNSLQSINPEMKWQKSPFLRSYLHLWFRSLYFLPHFLLWLMGKPKSSNFLQSTLMTRPDVRWAVAPSVKRTQLETSFTIYASASCLEPTLLGMIFLGWLWQGRMSPKRTSKRPTSAKDTFSVSQVCPVRYGPKQVGFDSWQSFYSASNFDGADFTNAIVDRASFKGSSLRGTIFTNAVLTGTTFDDADLEGSDFTEAAIGSFGIKQICKNPTLKGQNPVTGNDTRMSVGCGPS